MKINNYIKIKHALTLLTLTIFCYITSCSDELSQDTGFVVLVKGVNAEPIRSTSLEDSTPNYIAVELAQVILTKVEDGPTSLFSKENDVVYSVIDRDVKVFFKNLEDTEVNVDYSAVEVLFKVTDSSGNDAFNCVDSNGTKTPLTTADVIADFEQDGGTGCNTEETFCSKTLSDFTTGSFLTVGGKLTKSFKIKKTEDVKVYVQMYWKNILASSGATCRVPDFHVSLVN